jgi:hypothetical protein
MASRRPAAEQPVAPKLKLEPAAIERGVVRLGERIAELRAFNVASVPNGNSPELAALSTDIKGTLERCFGENTSAYRRFESAARLQLRPGVFTDNYPQRHHYQDGAKKNIEQSIVLLESAQRALLEDMEDAKHAMASLPAPTVPEAPELLRRVFVVHGHDGEAREMMVGFLRKLEFHPVVLQDEASRGRHCH